MVALTTLFTPSASCSQVVTSSGTLLWQGGILQKGDANCFPDDFAAIINSAYSPGVCPHGWVVDNQKPLFIPAPGETAVFCCPRGYSWITTAVAANNGNFCRSVLNGVATIYSADSLSIGPKPNAAPLTTVTANAASNTYVYQDIIQVRWRDSDALITNLFAQETAQASASARSSATSIPSATGSVLPASGSSTSTGISPGVIAAIVVSIVGVFLLISLAIWVRVLLRRRSHYKTKTRFSMQQWQRSELQGHATSNNMRNHSVRTQRNELPVYSKGSMGSHNTELAAVPAPVELPATRYTGEWRS